MQPIQYNPLLSITRLVLVALIAGAAAALITSYFFLSQEKPASELTDQDRIREHYLTETAVLVSPHGLRKKMDKGDKSFILVDLRSDEEYTKEHIIGAVNIPAYKDPNNSAYGDVERIVSSFQALINENPGKEVIAYCYSIPCMTGRKIGKMLAEHDIYVKELGVGWNEWRYFWNLWNHDSETRVPPEDYVVSGLEPGTPILREQGSDSPCTVSQEFGC